MTGPESCVLVMNKYPGCPFWNFCLTFLTTPLMSISVYCYFSNQLSFKKSHKPCWFGAETKWYPFLLWKTFRLICGPQEPKRIPNCSHSTLPQPLSVLLADWQKVFSQSWCPLGVSEEDIWSYILTPNTRLCVALLRKSLWGLWPSSLYLNYGCLATAQLPFKSASTSHPKAVAKKGAFGFPQNHLESPLGIAYLLCDWSLKGGTEPWWWMRLLTIDFVSRVWFTPERSPALSRQEEWSVWEGRKVIVKKAPSYSDIGL